MKETPQHWLWLDHFRISKYPITVAQYEAFIQSGGYRERRYWLEAEAAGKWRDGQIRVQTWQIYPLERKEGWCDRPADFGVPPVLSNHPVVGVSWYEALAFCRWLSEKLGTQVLLPTEAQWEKAALGVDGRVYPWNEEKITPDLANCAETAFHATSAVGIFPLGVSGCGALDMSGNVWEWCLSKSQEDYSSPPQHDPSGTDMRVLRGGAYYSSAKFVRCAVRNSRSPDSRLDYFGFRVVASALPEGGKGSPVS